MGVIFLIVFFFVSFLIVGLVLLQEGKGGGLTGMSTGMDGVMGAKNPLRKMTAWLFVLFVLLAISINYYFHNRADTVVPTGLAIPVAEMVDGVPVDSLRPEETPAESAADSSLPETLRPPVDESAAVEAPVAPLAPPPAESSAEGDQPGE